MYQSPSEAVLTAQEGAVLRIRLNRPGRRNMWTYELIVAAQEVVRRAAEDWDIRAVVFEGVGRDFCAGDDPEDLGPWPPAYAHRRPSGSHGPAPIPQQDLLRLVRTLPKPTIALLRGAVLGVGLDLACACDIRVCADDAVLGDPRVQQARHAATGITYVLPRLIGQSQAMRILLLGDHIDGKEAERLGLVYRSYPPEVFESEAGQLIERVTAMATRSYAVIKQQILEQLDLPYEAALMHSLAVRQTNVIEDREEAARAFLEKRPPRFRGR